jgi:HSP20 family molecular chaperone IbpA
VARNTAVGPARDSFESGCGKTRPRFRRPPRDSEHFRDSPAHIQQDESLPIEVAEDESEYKIIVSLSGIDPRKIYVFATPRSLLIEIRFKSTIYHDLPRALVTESIDRRISREFSLPIEIVQGATRVQISGDSLHITARKSEREQETSWSQLIHVDTLASLDLA